MERNSSNISYINQSSPFGCGEQNVSSSYSGHLDYISLMITQVASPMFLLVGIPGNLLTMVLVFRKRHNLTFTAVGLVVVALMDNLTLLTTTLPAWYLAVTGYDFRGHSPLVCKLVYFFANMSIIVSGLSLVALTTERVACIVWPYKVRSAFTTRASVYTHIGICAFTVVFSLYVFKLFTISDLTQEIYGVPCGYVDHLDPSNLPDVIWNWANNCLTFVIPFTLLFIGNVTLAIKLSGIGKIFSPQSNASESKNKRKKRLYVLITMLNVVFFISQCPIAMYLSLHTYINNWVFSVQCTEEFWYRLSLSRLILDITFCASYINPCVNVFLYVVGNQTFRRDIKELFQCKKAGNDTLFGD